MNVEVNELYALRSELDAAVEDNFGFCPNTDYFNSLEKRWRASEFEVKTLFPDEYKIYARKVYS